MCLGCLILIWCLDWISCSPPLKALRWYLLDQYMWHLGLKRKVWFWKVNPLLHWSHWECHHWLHGNNLTLWIIDNFWIGWKSVWAWTESWGETQPWKAEFWYNFSPELSLRPHLHWNEIFVLYLRLALVLIYFYSAETVFFKFVGGRRCLLSYLLIGSFTR